MPRYRLYLTHRPHRPDPPWEPVDEFEAAHDHAAKPQAYSHFAGDDIGVRLVRLHPDGSEVEPPVLLI